MTVRPWLLFLFGAFGSFLAGLGRNQAYSALWSGLLVNPWQKRNKRILPSVRFIWSLHFSSYFYQFNLLEDKHSFWYFWTPKSTYDICSIFLCILKLHSKPTQQQNPNTILPGPQTMVQCSGTYHVVLQWWSSWEPAKVSFMASFW